MVKKYIRSYFYFFRYI